MKMLWIVLGLIFDPGHFLLGNTDSLNNRKQIIDTCITFSNLTDTLPINCNCFNITYSIDGNLLQQGNLKNCLEEGQWFFYGGINTLIKVAYFSQGKRNGEFIKFWSNGKISIKCTYENDLYNGVFESYDQNGDTITKISYDHGKVLAYKKFKEWQPDGTITYKWISEINESCCGDSGKVEIRSAGVYLWQDGETFFLRNLTNEEIELNIPSMELNKIALKYFYISKD